MSGVVMPSLSLAPTWSGSTTSQHRTWAVSTMSLVKPPVTGSPCPTMTLTGIPNILPVATRTITGLSSWLARTTKSPSRTTTSTTLPAALQPFRVALSSTPSTASVSDSQLK